MKLETKRLILREMTYDDFNALFGILSDEETMKHYPKPFDGEKVKSWISSNIDSYNKYGFGLFSVIRKADGLFLGDCGITIQNINGKSLPEIGYHINARYQNLGYATEAAKECRDFFFRNTSYDAVYSYMKYTNIASQRVAQKNGMKLTEEYDDPKNKITEVYSITRGEWENLR